MEEIIDATLAIVVIGTLLLLLILTALMIGLWVKVNRLRRRYVRMMNTDGLTGLEEVMIQIHHDIEQLKEEQKILREKLEQVTRALSHIKGNVGIHRYNAFAQSGSDLSFSLAIINDNQDGVVISGLHARDETYVYAKPLKQGQSAYALTPEEKHAIHLALQKE